MMKWFNNLKISRKLISCFIAVAIFTGVVGFMGINSMSAINDRGHEIYEVNFISSKALADINKNLQVLRANYVLMLYERNLAQLQPRLDEINILTAGTNEALQTYETKIQTDEERSLYNSLIESLGVYRNVRTEHLNMVAETNYDEAHARISEFTAARESVEEDLNRLIEFNLNAAEEKVQQNAANYENQSLIMIVIACIGVVLAIALGLIIARLIGKPIVKLVESANKIADGDLDVHIDINSKDEIGDLASAFRAMADNINDVMNNIAAASEQVSAGAKQVSDSSMELSQGATEQASSVEELTASLEEIASQTELNANNANNANKLEESLISSIAVNI